MLRSLATICLGLCVSTMAPAGLDDFPSDLEKWIDTDPPKAGSDRWGVANYDVKHEWVVNIRDGRPWVQPHDRHAENLTPLPFEIEQGQARDGLAGKRRVIKVSDGWIVAFNAGEFGAGLWWFSPDGEERYKIAKAWINGFFSTKEGLLAIEGLAHLSGDRGRIIRLSQAPGGRWRSEDFVILKHCPKAAAIAADGSLMVATTEQLLKIEPAGKKVEVLVDGTAWGSLYPNSMVITPAGIVYVGMRHCVAKVEEKGGSWKYRWLLPSKAFNEKESRRGSK